MGVLYCSGEKSAFTVGRDPGCDFVLDGLFVSRKHLRINAVTSDAAFVEVLGANGAVIDGRKLNKGDYMCVLAGECIHIGKYSLVWTGLHCEQTGTFVRGLAGRPSVDLAGVEIEGPPPRKPPEKASIALAAGPALTMAIPVLLGAGRSVAVLSSIFAAIFAASNVLSRVRKQKVEEKRRRSAYTAYLHEMESTIQKRLMEVRTGLNEAYPGIGMYFSGGFSPFLLWNAPRMEDGSLEVRYGTGMISNPITISFPKERFAQTPDSLRSLPSELCKKYEYLPGCPIMQVLSKRTITAVIIKREEDMRFLFSLILQAAVSYPPDEVTVRLGGTAPFMESLSWMVYLPHYSEEDAGAGAGSDILFVTDDEAAAFDAAMRGCIVIFAAGDEKSIPKGACIVQNQKGGKGMIPDRIERALCFSYAEKMSALWQDHDMSAKIPDMVCFPDLFDIPYSADPREHIMRMITENYEKNDITAGISAPVGMISEGEKMVLDLHEKAAGPHGLIAGTTGSGKSELLTTLILSFASMYPPDRLAFLLIDYKGGGMSNLFERLPHVIGSISNLTKAATQRAMTSLKAENIRRQELFLEAGVNNINDYTRLCDASPTMEPLPHVFIIVDEFAELRKEEPEFMDRLISISQVGRSLGMHLILATQKPSGVVDDRIRSNSRFRIALRLVDRADSTDLIGCPKAAEIRQCGRAYLQVGNNEVFECFQSGYAMGHVSERKKVFKLYEDRFCRHEMEGPAVCEDKTAEETWYGLFMDALTEVDEKLARKKGKRLWLPPLPYDLADERACLVFDDPYRQKYERIIYDPQKTGHVLIAGRSGSGKSELVHTMIERLGGKASVYIIDPLSGPLTRFDGCTFCGGCVKDDTDDMIRMLLFINDEMESRRAGLSPDRGYDRMILVLEDMSGIIKAAPEASELITQILTFGRSKGINVIATFLSVPDIRFSELFDTVWLLGSVDAYVAASVLHVPARDIPGTDDVRGRGIGVLEKVPLEFQTVRVSGIPERSPPGGLIAVKYPHVPKKPTLEHFLQTEFTDDKMPGPFPAGYIKKTGRIFYIPFDKVRCVLVSGKQYSGRHTFLFNISITASFLGVKCVRADSCEALLSIGKNVNGFTIVTIDSVLRLLEEHYSKPPDPQKEEELAACFENPVFDTKLPAGQMAVVAIVENECAYRFASSRIFASITKHMYGISFGGNLDENRLFDFSYLPFSQQQKPLKSHNATILKYDEKSFWGDIAVPAAINVDNSQMQ